jgi:outer membrane protein
MKKFFTAAFVVIALSMANAADAQMKIGYISVDNMVGLMPDLTKIDTMLQKYQADSLNPQYAYLISEYNRKDSMVNTRDSVKYKGAVGAQIRQEMQEIAGTIQNWQQLTNQAMEAKQNELLRPVYAKVYDAIKAVAKEKGYTHVFNKEAFLVAPEGDDMILDVAKRLKVTVPTQSGIKPPVKTGN